MILPHELLNLINQGESYTVEFKKSARFMESAPNALTR